MTASRAVPGSKVAGASSSGRHRNKEKNEPEQDAPATSAMKTSDIHIRDPYILPLPDDFYGYLQTAKQVFAP